MKQNFYRRKIMDKLDLRKKYDYKDLVKIINKLIEENNQLKKELGQKVDYSEYRRDPIFYS